MSTPKQEIQLKVSTVTGSSKPNLSRPRHTYGARCLLAWLLAGSGAAWSDIGILPPPLKELTIPQSPALLEGPDPIVINREKAILLGKALFWDMAVGSDGIACASCHFHAGADSRTKNQLAPSHAFSPRPDAPNGFDPADPRGPALANYQLRSSDFPLHDPDRPGFDASKATHNVVASSGTFSGTFISPPTNGSKVDVCSQYGGEQLDKTFHVGSLHTRRVEPRNAPTVINSVLFDRNFWDGRANFYFNGVSSSGPRDQAARIWVNTPSGVHKAHVQLSHSSFASVAVEPPLSSFEMSCQGRTWPDIGRKLLSRRALQVQWVHPRDSVLGPLRHSSGMGLDATYEDLVKQSFAPRFWSAGVDPQFGKPGYSNIGFSQSEVNFSFFFGIATQLYASTLISDDTRFDKSIIEVTDQGEFVDLNPDPATRLSTRELNGLRLFNEAHCIFCHSGPLFSSATDRETLHHDGDAILRTMVKRERTADRRYRMIDEGYLNNGAAPSSHDVGINANDAFGNPLAFAPQYLASLAGRPAAVIEPLPRILGCEIGFNADNPMDFFKGSFTSAELVPDPAGSDHCLRPDFAVVPRPEIAAAALDDPSNVRLAPGGNRYKVPQLYNVELTGPYMHNGGMSSLEQVVEQYMRGGNFQYFGGQGNPEIDMFFMFAIGMSEQDRDDVVAFLKTLTDERVRFERAPFDHPQLKVPHGHPGDHRQTEAVSWDPTLAADTKLIVPAVGQGGRATPLPSFQEILDTPH